MEIQSRPLVENILLHETPALCFFFSSCFPPPSNLCVAIILSEPPVQQGRARAAETSPVIGDAGADSPLLGTRPFLFDFKARNKRCFKDFFGKSPLDMMKLRAVSMVMEAFYIVIVAAKWKFSFVSGCLFTYFRYMWIYISTTTTTSEKELSLLVGFLNSVTSSPHDFFPWPFNLGIKGYSSVRAWLKWALGFRIALSLFSEGAWHPLVTLARTRRVSSKWPEDPNKNLLIITLDHILLDSVLTGMVCVALLSSSLTCQHPCLFVRPYLFKQLQTQMPQKWHLLALASVSLPSVRFGQIRCTENWPKDSAQTQTKLFFWYSKNKLLESWGGEW